MWSAVAGERLSPHVEPQEEQGGPQVLLGVVVELAAVAEERGSEREVGRIDAVVQAFAGVVAALVELAVLVSWDPYVVPRTISSRKYPMRLPVRY